MNVYDFDNTIYRGDSTLDFYKFCIRKNPLLLRYLVFQIYAFFLYILGIYNKTKLKESFFCFLKGIENIDCFLYEFWKNYKYRIAYWYLIQKENTDVIISASPEFLLRPVANELGIHLIASVVCKKSGKYTGVNCYGEEKVRRFYEKYPQGTIENFYSDSISDKYMAKIAKNSYIIIRGEKTAWNSYAKTPKNLFKSREFLAFLLIGAINVFNGVLFASIFSFFLHSNLAFILGYILSMSVSYLLNAKITFQSTLRLNGYINFVLSYIPNFIIQNIIVLTLYNYLELNRLIAYISAALIGVPLTFIIVKLWVYTPKNK